MIADRYYFQQHRMVWALLGFLCGCLLLWATQPMWWLVLAVVTVVLAVGSFYHGRTEGILFLLLCLLGMGIMQVQLQQLTASSPYLGQTITVTGTVVEHGRGQSYLWLQPAQNGIANKTNYYVTLPYHQDGDEMAAEEATAFWYPAGSRIAVRGKLLAPQGQRNPGGFDEVRWLRSKQAQYQLQAEDIQLLQEPQGVWYGSWQIQQTVMQLAEQYLDAPLDGLALALLLGQKQQLEPAFYRLTQRMGIAHIFAVSGLHVGFVGTVLLLLLRLLGQERSWLSFLLLLVVLSGYCVLTGLSSAAVRATIMLLLSALALRLLRPMVGVDFLALAALVLLLDNPWLLFTAGFQLSFGVTLSLLVLVRPIEQMLHWIGWRWLRDGVAVALAAMLGSLPLSAWHFYGVSLLAPLYNLLLVPLVSLLVPLLLLAFLGAWLHPFVGVCLFVPARLLLQLLWQGANLLQQMTGGGQFYTGRPSWLAVLLYLAGLFLFWRLLCRKQKKAVRGWVALFSLFVLVIALCYPKPPAADTLLYLDTGQGSCALLRTTAGEAILFDGGASQQELASCLAWYGINRVQAIILSHGDSDHISGLAQVLERVPVDMICVEGTQWMRETMEPLRLLAEQKEVAVKTITDEAVLHLHQGTIYLQLYVDNRQRNNSRELTALLQTPWATVAFPGDLAAQGALQFVRNQQQIDIWTVPHHGSRSAASVPLYEALQQKGVQRAVISAGVNNRYGHPHGEVLQLLEQANISYQRTDEQGAVEIHAATLQPAETDSKSMNISNK